LLRLAALHVAGEVFPRLVELGLLRLGSGRRRLRLADRVAAEEAQQLFNQLVRLENAPNDFHDRAAGVSTA
jgi:hypothetical protein